MTSLFLVSAVKLIAEIALLALAGRLVLGLLAGANRERNVFYRLLQLLSDPFVKGLRAITPRVVLDRHMPLAAFVAMAMVWVGATLMKIRVCLEIGIAQCR